MAAVFSIASLSQSPDHGRVAENCVFLELLRRAYTIHYFKGKRGEADFITERDDEPPQVIQVCWMIDENKCIKHRELRGLREGMDALGVTRGLVLTRNTEREEVIDVENGTGTITYLPIWKWLLQEHWEPETETDRQ